MDEKILNPDESINAFLTQIQTSISSSICIFLETKQALNTHEVSSSVKNSFAISLGEFIHGTYLAEPTPSCSFCNIHDVHPVKRILEVNETTFKLSIVQKSLMDVFNMYLVQDSNISNYPTILLFTDIEYFCPNWIASTERLNADWNILRFLLDVASCNDCFRLYQDYYYTQILKSVSFNAIQWKDVPSVVITIIQGRDIILYPWKLLKKASMVSIDTLSPSSSNYATFKSILPTLRSTTDSGADDMISLWIKVASRGVVESTTVHVLPLSSSKLQSVCSRTVFEQIESKLLLPFLFQSKSHLFPILFPNAVLLRGQSTTSHLTLADEIAKTLSARFLHVSCTQLFSKYVGVTEENLRRAFNSARALKPSVLFLDSIETIGASRNSKGAIASSVVHDTLLATLLNELDGIEDYQTSRSVADFCLVIASTDQKNSLDPALIRPGRFDVEIDTE
jgi:ATPase family associated with various cellular activities (AAA)